LGRVSPFIIHQCTRLTCRFLFLNRSTQLHHLHSFPTRRSSDLSPLVEVRAESANHALTFHLPLVPHSSSGRRGWARRNCRKWRQDRKSTRLNSSHRTTSYAVLCLKKKRAMTRSRQCERC